MEPERRHRHEQDGINDGKDHSSSVGLDRVSDDAIDEKSRTLIFGAGGFAEVVNEGDGDEDVGDTVGGGFDVRLCDGRERGRVMERGNGGGRERSAELRPTRASRSQTYAAAINQVATPPTHSVNLRTSQFST